MPRKGKGQKVSTAGGQTYGKRAEQEEVQRVVPLAQARPAVLPGAMGGVTRPTERPSEAVTSGSPVGPGPGPEILSRPAPGRPSAEYSAKLQAWMPMLEAKAALPGTSLNFRTFVRRVRMAAGQAPGVN